MLFGLTSPVTIYICVERVVINACIDQILAIGASSPRSLLCKGSSSGHDSAIVQMRPPSSQGIWLTTDRIAGVASVEDAAAVIDGKVGNAGVTGVSVVWLLSKVSLFHFAFYRWSRAGNVEGFEEESSIGENIHRRIATQN